MEKQSLSPDIKQAIIQDYVSGMSIPAISAKHALPITTIYDIVDNERLSAIHRQEIYTRKSFSIIFSILVAATIFFIVSSMCYLVVGI